MDKFDRVQKLHRIFKSKRYPVNTRALAQELGCGEATIKRNIRHLIDLHNAPLVHKPRCGWIYDDPENTFELAGTWLTSDELIGLTSLLDIIDTMNADFISDELKPIQQQIEKMLEARAIPAKPFHKKIKIISTNKQSQNSKLFNTVSEALICNKQLSLQYKSYRSEESTRIISPQKLVHYQENWYLDSYCHKREALRTFKLSRMQDVWMLVKKAKVVPQKQLNDYFASSYGIFAGKATRTAKLRFEGDTAHEVAMQSWHPEQIGEWQGNNYVLTIPFNEDKELIRDILKHGNNVEVLSPTTLRKKITNIAAGIIGINTGKRARI